MSLVRIALAIGAAGLAQAAPLPAQRTELPPIEITVTRSTQDLDRIPAAVTVLEADALRRGRAAVSLSELLDQVPGLFVQNAGNFAQDTRLALRGFGARSAFGIRGVTIVVDGIPQTLPDGQSQVDSIDLAAVERIEVLRGPASALYGNGAGGVIRITTRDPESGAGARFEQTVGEHGLVATRASLNGGNDRVAARLTAGRLESDGFRRHAKANQKRAALRLVWTPGTATRADFTAGWFETPGEQDPGGLTAAQARASPRAARPANVMFDAGESLEQWRFGGAIEHRIGGTPEQRVRLSGFGYLRDFSNRLPFTDGGQVAFEREFFGIDAQYELETRWFGTAQRLTAGVDLRDQADQRQRFDNLDGLRGARVLDQRERVESIGMYLRHQVEPAPGWTVTAGARFDEVRLDVNDRLLVDGDDSGARTWREVSPAAGIVWRVARPLSLHVSVGTSFQTPTTTELANPDDPGSGGGFNPDLGAQTAHGVELGLRGRPGRGLRYEASVFRMRIDDAITNFEVPEFSGTGREFFRNAGRSTRRGVEASLEARLADRWHLRAGYTYSDFEFDRFVTPDGDFGGNRLPGVPRHAGYLSLDFDAPIGWFAGADLRAAGQVIANNANTAASPDHVVVGMHAGRRLAWRRLEAALEVGIENLFDERYIDNVRVNAFGGRFFEPAPGRAVHASVRLEWSG